MPRPKKTTLVSFQHAFEGIAHVIWTQRRVRGQMVAAVLVFVAGAWVRLAREQWFAVCFALALVFLAEMMNTAISACVDLYAEKYHPVAGRGGQACQIASAATLVATVVAAIVIALVFIKPPL